MILRHLTAGCNAFRRGITYDLQVSRGRLPVFLRIQLLTGNSAYHPSVKDMSWMTFSTQMKLDYFTVPFWIVRWCWKGIRAMEDSVQKNESLFSLPAAIQRKNFAHWLSAMQTTHAVSKATTSINSRWHTSPTGRHGWRASCSPRGYASLTTRCSARSGISFWGSTIVLPTPTSWWVAQLQASDTTGME